jgi:hypothetical protein
MTLLDRCKTLRAEIVRRDALLREVKEAEKYNERTREIRELREALAHATRRITVLREHHIEVPRLRNAGAVLERLSGYLQRVTENASESGPDHGRTKRSLDAIRESLESAADAKLEAVIQDLPAIEETFLKQVEANPAYASKVVEIRAARDELRRKSRKTMTADELDAFLKEREALRTLADNLKPEDFPKEVLEFFTAARHGARLEKLTEGVRRWLAERNQLNNIRLYVVDPAVTPQ